jgi:hypothetical protein
LALGVAVPPRVEVFVVDGLAMLVARNVDRRVGVVAVRVVGVTAGMSGVRLIRVDEIPAAVAVIGTEDRVGA